MIKTEHVEVFNLEGAVRGMRNPFNSWDKSDSDYEPANFCDNNFVIGEKDLDLMRRLYKAGNEHRKYLRQIFVSMDITAPLYWWKQFDKYQIGVTTNSCSTMHKLMSKDFEFNDFSFDFIKENNDYVKILLNTLNSLRHYYLEEKNPEQKKSFWYNVVRLLPEGYNQKRTVTMNYENVVSIIKQRAGHKLKEWDDFIIELKNLPYIKEIIDNKE